jgi:hypothetical protein
VGHFGADGISETYVRHYAVAEEGVYAVPGAVEELGGDNEVEGLVLLFQRAYGRNGNYSFDAQLLEAINIGSEIQFAGQELVSARVAG